MRTLARWVCGVSRISYLSNELTDWDVPIIISVKEGGEVADGMIIEALPVIDSILEVDQVDNLAVIIIHILDSFLDLPYFKQS